MIDGVCKRFNAGAFEVVIGGESCDARGLTLTKPRHAALVPSDGFDQQGRVTAE